MKWPYLVLGICGLGLLIFAGIKMIGGSETKSAQMAATSDTDAPLLNYTSTPMETSTAIIPTDTLSDLAIGSSMLSEKDSMVLLYVPAGEFIMGSEDGDGDESPVHSIYLDAYWIDQTEVTNEQYRLCVEAGVCDEPTSYYFGKDNYTNHPVVFVGWDDANDYCTWAGRRLPTEAEWEKAARGTDSRTYPWGNESPSSNLLNYNRNVDGTTPVGSYPAGASPYGALDMGGNVWEWVGDWYDKSYYEISPEENPTGAESGKYRILRGGARNSNEKYVGAAYRNNSTPAHTSYNGGFRCALSP